MAGPRGLEPRTTGLEGRCSIRLSYGPLQRDLLSMANSTRGWLSRTCLASLREGWAGDTRELERSPKRAVWTCLQPGPRTSWAFRLGNARAATI